MTSRQTTLLPMICNSQTTSECNSQLLYQATEMINWKGESMGERGRGGGRERGREREREGERELEEER